MKSHYVEETLAYDGSQLRPLWAYEKFGVLGPSVVGFRGPCEVKFDKMVDLEDLRDQAEIRGGAMVHFIVEIFEGELWGAVSFQRLMAGMVGETLRDLSNGKLNLRREGDDLYFQDRKLSISIAAKSTQSLLVHFAVNEINDGTPVKTCALSDFGIAPEVFARTFLARLTLEFNSIMNATYKARPL